MNDYYIAAMVKVRSLKGSYFLWTHKIHAPSLPLARQKAIAIMNDIGLEYAELQIMLSTTRADAIVSDQVSA